jgi:acyl-coenzyme A thioesterase PaaI-like protein
MQPSVLTAEDLERRLAEAFPEAFHPDSGLAIVDVWHRGCRVRMGFAAHRLRPGGTISGPNLMLLAECRLIKLGRRLAVGDIGIRSEAGEDLVAHATSTYSIPPIS